MELSFTNHALRLTAIFLYGLLHLAFGQARLPSVGQVNPAKIQPEKASAPGEAQFLELLFSFEDQSASLLKAAIYPGKVSTRSYILEGNWCRAELIDASGIALYSESFRDPRVRFYDEVDPATEKLSGGFLFSDRASISLRLPLLNDAAGFRLLSPEDQTLYQTGLPELLRAARGASPSPALPWDTETLIYNGDPDNRIDLLFMGDGYISADTALFRNDVIEFTDHLFSTSPYDEYQSYFNVHLIYVISAERGADHPEANPPVYRNTALGAYYNCYNTPRLICLDEDTVYAIANATLPFYDKIIVLVNDPVYGGAGGAISISYNGAWGKWVFNHEFGHSFGYLLDEYLYGNQPGSVSGCNCDTDNLHPQWEPWIIAGSPGVGAFQGCSWTNYYRPTYNECTMNTLMDNFCVVCREQLAKTVNARVLLCDDFFPPGNPTIQLGQTQEFWVTPLTPASHQLRTHWYLNGNPLGGAASDSFSFTPASTGVYEVMAVIFDSTDLVLSDPEYLMVDAVEWRLQVNPPTGLGEEPGAPLAQSFQLFPNFPNPFNAETVIRYYLPAPATISLEIYDLWGRRTRTLAAGRKAAGEHSLSWDGTAGNSLPVPSGIYFCTLLGPAGTKISRKMMVVR
ncbi:MAG: T9SS type A sorting domain-containing protein [Calditrichaceae bacterium]|nr:M64 family metallo-endopeptidase [Calditrichia bacterium]NUQ40738.1 T9SS type A sorting domain-containing protein [Calditrichaceae bacterium]